MTIATDTTMAIAAAADGQNGRILEGRGAVEIPGNTSEFAIGQKIMVNFEAVRDLFSYVKGPDGRETLEPDQKKREEVWAKNPVMIEHVSRNIQQWFWPLTEKPSAYAMLSRYDARKPSTDFAAFQKLKSNVPQQTLFSQIYFLMEKEEQRYRGGSGRKTPAILLEKPGYNVFFVFDKDGKTRAVYVQRGSHGWIIWAHEFEKYFLESKDRRIFAYGIPPEVPAKPQPAPPPEKKTEIPVVIPSTPPVPRVSVQSNGNSHNGGKLPLGIEGQKPRALLGNGKVPPKKGRKKR